MSKTYFYINLVLRWNISKIIWKIIVKWKNSGVWNNSINFSNVAVRMWEKNL